MTFRDKRLHWPDKKIKFTFSGSEVTAVKGDSIASALSAAGFALHDEVKSKVDISLDIEVADKRRSRVFCGMGVCQQCLVTIDGQPSQRACRTSVHPGMVVSKQFGLISPMPEHADIAIKQEMSFDVVIVGAGPSGLSAGRVSALSGLSTLIVDENDTFGGQYYKQLQSELNKIELNQDLRHKEGIALAKKTSDAGALIWNNTVVWHAENKEEGKVFLSMNRNGSEYLIKASSLIIATGARELPISIPGWDLPNVITCGGLQILKRRYGVIPEGPYLFVGNGPLLLNVAHDFANEEPLTSVVLEMSKPFSFQHLSSIASMGILDFNLMKQGTLFHFGLLKNRIPYKQGITPLRINKDQDSLILDWIDIKGNLHQSKCKTLVMSGGLISNNELSDLLGVIPVEGSSTGETNLTHIKVVGEALKIGGYKKAILEGEMAASTLGSAVDKKIKAKYSKIIKFQSALADTFTAKQAMIDNDMVVCRCEQVTAMQIRDALKCGHISSSRGLKQATRCGMGVCQGKYCQKNVDRILKGETNIAPEAMTIRPPLRPIKLSFLSEEQPEWAGHTRTKPHTLTLSEKESNIKSNSLDIDCVVIGGGLIGLFSAYHLVKKGKSVIVVDAGRTNGQASGGNAGSLHAQLLSFDFTNSAKLGPVDHTLSLQCQSIDYWHELETTLGVDFEMIQEGGLMVADNAEGMSKLEVKVKRELQLGVNVELIDKEQLQKIEPMLSHQLHGAAFCHQEGKINPHKAAMVMKELLENLGAVIYENNPVKSITKVKSGFNIDSKNLSLHCGHVINSAGAWSSEVARMLKTDIPVFGAPLQMIVTEPVTKVTSRLIAHVDRHLTLKQAHNGNFIIGGGWTGGYDPISKNSTIQLNSLKGNAWIAEKVMPLLGSVNIIRSWAAMNIDIDGAPIVGEDKAVKGLFHAVSSNGITLAPLIGKIVADLVVDGKNDTMHDSFLPDRF